MYIYNCPHCNGTIMTEEKETNCKIFRHGVYKKSGNQINPHEKKEICDDLYEKNEIYGCGKPYRLILNNNSCSVEICDYI